MKKLIKLKIAVCLMLLTSPLIVSGGEITHQISAGDYEITNDSGLYRINMLTPGYSVIQSPGDPALPEKTLEFEAPKDIDMSSIKLQIESVESEVLPGLYDIAPNPPLKTDFEEYWGVGKNIVNGRNMNVYGKDANFPEESVELLPPMERKELVEIETDEGMFPKASFKMVNYLRVKYRPFLYNPVSQKLTLVRNVTIRISYDNRATVENEQMSSSSTYESVQSPQISSSGSTYDYVIITTNDIVANSKKLANFVYLKELSGHNVKVVTETDFGGLTGQLPNGTAEKIRQWLINNYIQLGIDYVLLIGDPDPDDPMDPSDTVGDIPMKMCFPHNSDWGNREAPTDYFYAELTGNWDLDGDWFFGELLPIDWPETSPDPLIGDDTFSVRWIGEIEFDYSADYELKTLSDDGVRLYIDGNLLIDNWTLHPAKWDSSGLISIQAGRHEVILELFENTGEAMIHLTWQTFNCKLGDPCFALSWEPELIPSDHLIDVYDNSGGLTGIYFDNPDFTEALVIRKDASINFFWGTGDMGNKGSETGPETGAEVFVGRIPVYDNDDEELNKYEQLDKILEKIIRYETDPGDISWRESILLPIKPSDDNTPGYHLGEGIRNDFALSAGFTCYRIYEEDYSLVPGKCESGKCFSDPSVSCIVDSDCSGGPTPEKFPCSTFNTVDEWVNGYGMVTWWTHGGEERAEGIFTSDYAEDLDDTKPAFTFQCSCLNGYPENSNNLGYALLKQGAVATVSATRVSFYDGGSIIFDPKRSKNPHNAYYYTKKVIDDGFPKPAGVALSMIKKDIDTMDMNIMDYNLYGDPACYLLATVPNYPPVADANGPYSADCEGTTTAVQLDGTGSSDPDGDLLTYSWETDCPGGTFNPSTSATPELSVDTLNGCFACSVTLTVTDPLGNTDSDTVDVMISDTSPPLLTCPPHVTIECDESSDPSNTGEATATDNCDSSPTITFEDDIHDSTPLCESDYLITRTWKAEDECGNVGTCDQIITLVDTTAPVIYCNAPATITPPDAPISFTATAIDNCDDDPSVEITVFDCFKYTKKGKHIDKKESCVVSINGDTITINDSGGVDDIITWEVSASDCTGNTSTSTCTVNVVNPAQ